MTLDDRPKLHCAGHWPADGWQEICALDLGHPEPWCQNALGTVRWTTLLDLRQGDLLPERWGKDE